MRAWRTAPARLPPPPCTTTIAAPVRDGAYQPARRKPSELRNQTFSWAMAKALAGTGLRGFPLTNSAVPTGITTHSSARAGATTPTARRPQRAGRRRAGGCAIVTTAQPIIAAPAGTSSTPVHAPPSAEPTLTCQTARPPATAAMSPATNAPSARGPRGSRGQTPTAPAANSTATIAAGAPVDALAPRQDDRKAASSQCSAHRPAAAPKTDAAVGARPTRTRAGRIRTAAADMARVLFDRRGEGPAATQADGAAAVERRRRTGRHLGPLAMLSLDAPNLPPDDLGAHAGCQASRPEQPRRGSCGLPPTEVRTPGTGRERAGRRTARRRQPTSHGMRARSVVPTPGGLQISSSPPIASTRSLRPRKPEPCAAFAPPMPSSRTVRRTWPGLCWTVTLTTVALAYLATFVSASATT